MLKIGSAKKDITPFIPGIGLMGWGIWGNRVKEVHSRLFARAYVFQSPVQKETFVFVCAEISSISLAIREEVIRIIQEDHADLSMNPHYITLTATHMHSSPGGYSHYSLFNITIPGFSQRVFNTYVQGIVDAIVAAWHHMQPAVMRYDDIYIPDDEKVAFNRSIEAYNLNKDIRPVHFRDRHLALDRYMRMLRFDAIDGTSIGSINWFSVHANSIHSNGNAISSDNKGYAAARLEEWMVSKGISGVASFAQGAAGDSSPNYKMHKGERFYRGKYRRDEKNVIINGAIQYKYAKKLYKRAADVDILPSLLDGILTYINLAAIEVDPDFCTGKVPERTGAPVLGTSFLISTTDTQGLPGWMCKIFENWSKLAYKQLRKEAKSVQGSKLPFMELANNTVLGVNDLANTNIPEWMDPTIRPFKEQAKIGAFSKYPMVPEIVPIQIMVLGNMALLATPCEFTTVAGRRLIAAVKNVLSSIGIENIIIAGYANAYAGYCVTPEEYEARHYEADSTYFGKYTLGAFQTAFKSLALELCKPKDQRVISDLKPIVFDKNYLATYEFDHLWKAEKNTY